VAHLDGHPGGVGQLRELERPHAQAVAAELNGQRLTGTIFESSGEEMGPFDLQLTPEFAEGTLTTLFDSVTVTGPRVF
jgi:hypothetical protein